MNALVGLGDIIDFKNVQSAKKLLTHLIQSLQSEPSGCEGAYGRNPKLGKF
ncbi:MAG: hypothetical protein ACO2PP_13120 [Thermocrinis sp.]|jgi:hypothetical protein|uniref:hypothetical protein n=1 Tax=Thermocrinis sp. TaxID=2024383 RepID=UPI003C02DDE6